MNLSVDLNDPRISYHRYQVFQIGFQEIIIIAHNLLKTKFGLIKIQIDNPSSYQSNVFRTLKQIISVQKEITLEKYKKKILKYKKCLILKCFGIIGFPRFLLGYYIQFISEVKEVAMIGNNKIFKIENTIIKKLFINNDKNLRNQEEKQFNLIRYLDIYKEFNIDSHFYFSNSYNLTLSLQQNLFLKQKPDQKVFNTQLDKNYNWNENLNDEFLEQINDKKWYQNIIHGFIQQRQFQQLDTVYQLVLIARRSKYHAGARYIKRGVNEKGQAANFVETEQILIDKFSTPWYLPRCSSFIQIRGSIPIYWFQKPQFHNPKPLIQIYSSDPFYIATKQHMYDLIKNYGKNIILVNLVKNEAQEGELAKKYEEAIRNINNQIFQDGQIQYYHIDHKFLKKQQKLNFRNFEEFKFRTKQLAKYFVEQTSFFQLNLNNNQNNQNQTIKLQKGVLRSNCVDCLDRTNQFQFFVGQVALNLQFQALNNQGQDFQIEQKIIEHYQEMFEQMGDAISVQYGGSNAHKLQQQISTNILTSLVRHFSNSFTDQQKQQSLDIFLNNYQYKTNDNMNYTPNILFYPSLVDKQIYSDQNWFKQAQEQFEEKQQFEFKSKSQLIFQNTFNNYINDFKFLCGNSQNYLQIQNFNQQFLEKIKDQEYVLNITLPNFSYQTEKNSVFLLEKKRFFSHNISVDHAFEKIKIYQMSQTDQQNRNFVKSQTEIGRYEAVKDIIHQDQIIQNYNYYDDLYNYKY